MFEEKEGAVGERPFRSCERCGRPTPFNLPQCVNCGAISVQSVVAEERERAVRRYARALFSRATPAVYAILVANAFVFALMEIVSGGSEDPATLIAFGAKTNEQLRSGEWFRLVTPIFIHAGLPHLLLNSYALWAVGTQVEKLYGSARFLLIYLLSGVGGVAGSYLGQMFLREPSNIPSVGASGAIFGLFGVLAVFGFKYRSETPPAIRRAMTAGVLPVIVINLFIGASVPFIDNSAHVGGLLAGATLALIVPYVAPGRERISKTGLAIIALCLAAIVYCFAQAYLERQRGLVIEGFLSGINSAQKALLRAFDPDLNGAPQQEKESATAKLAEAIDELRDARTPDAESDRIRRELLRIARRQHSLLTSPAADEDKREDEINANRGDYGKAWERLENWVKADGQKYGLVLKEGDK